MSLISLLDITQLLQEQNFRPTADPQRPGFTVWTLYLGDTGHEVIYRDQTALFSHWCGAETGLGTISAALSMEEASELLAAFVAVATKRSEVCTQ